MWNFLGSFIFPDDATVSDFFCLGLGYALVLLLFLFEELLASMTLKMALHGFYYKLIWEDFIYTVIFFCTAILWRGGWNLTATYIIPDYKVGGWFCFSIGSVLLISMQLFSYVCCHGVAIDGNDPGRDAVFPTKYLRVYITSCLSKKVWMSTYFYINNVSHENDKFNYLLSLFKSIFVH